MTTTSAKIDEEKLNSGLSENGASADDQSDLNPVSEFNNELPDPLELIPQRESCESSAIDYQKAATDVPQNDTDQNEPAQNVENSLLLRRDQSELSSELNAAENILRKTATQNTSCVAEVHDPSFFSAGRNAQHFSASTITIEMGDFQSHNMPAENVAPPKRSQKLNDQENEGNFNISAERETLKTSASFSGTTHTQNVNESIVEDSFYGTNTTSNNFFAKSDESLTEAPPSTWDKESENSPSKTDNINDYELSGSSKHYATPNNQQTVEQCFEKLFQYTEIIIIHLYKTYSKTTLEHMFKIDVKIDEIGETKPSKEGTGRDGYITFLQNLKKLCGNGQAGHEVMKLNNAIEEFREMMSGRSSDVASGSTNNILFLIFWVKTRCWIADNNPTLELKPEIDKLSSCCCSCCCQFCFLGVFCCCFVESRKSVHQIENLLGHCKKVACRESAKQELGKELNSTQILNETSTDNEGHLYESMSDTTESQNPEFLDFLFKNFKDTLEVKCFLIILGETCCCGLIRTFYHYIHDKFYIHGYLKNSHIRKIYKNISACCSICGTCFICSYALLMLFITLSGVIFLIWKVIEKISE